jgi:NAD(P)-dependent dehydrogenase (short-subunit alcohol dehydrogenase family)
MPESGEHKGRVAIVAGGGALAEALASRLRVEGAQVNGLILPEAGRRQNRSASERVSIRLAVDFSSETEIQAAFDAVASRHRRVDYLVVCPEGFSPRSFLELECEQWNRTIAVDLTGTFLCCRSAVRIMRAQQFGRIVLFSSTLARSGLIHGAHYAASKGGVLGLARTLALEVAHENIRVNTVSPGPGETYAIDQSAPQGALPAMQRRVPLGRRGRVDDLVEAALFLLGNESSYFTGQDIRVDGGALLW